MVHEINLRGYTASCNTADNVLQLGTAGSYGIERLHITADSAWDGLTLTASFTNAGKTTTVSVINGMADVPPEATQDATRDRVRYGAVVITGCDADGNVRRISTSLMYVVLPHGGINGKNTITPTPDQYAQFVATVKADADRAENAAETTAETLTAEVRTATEAANTAAQSANTAAANPPKISDNGTWLMWSASDGAYHDTGYPANGADGKEMQLDATLTDGAKAAPADVVGEIKGDLAEVNNTKEAPVAAGKVWTSTANGAGWADPQGGSDGNYELITQFTLEQEVGYLKIASDSNGSPINHKSIYVVIETPEATKAYSIYFWFMNDENNISMNPQSTYIANVYNTKKRYTSVSIIASGSFRNIYFSSPSIDTRSPEYVSTLAIPDTTGYKIQSINLRSMDSALGLLVGTKITVYGIK